MILPLVKTCTPREGVCRLPAEITCCYEALNPEARLGAEGLQKNSFYPASSRFADLLCAIAEEL